MEYADRTHSRRGALKLTAFLAALLMAFIALNGPVTLSGVNSASAAVTSAQETSENTVADVAEQANPATVTVLNLQQQQDGFGQSSDEVVPVGSGSGYIVDAAGYVVTNSHVVEGGADFQVQLYDGTIVEASLVGADAYQDVAVLKLELTDGQTLPGVLTFGDSSTLRAGDTVIAIGSPFGEFTNSVTAGIVNALDRSLETGLGYELPNLVQHNADIYPGNSGGPLLNTDGEVVGMNVAKAVEPTMDNSSGDTNIGFAIESNAVKEIVDEIIATGTFARSYLGIRTQPTEIGQGVMDVEAGGPADLAGLQAGDVITAIDGQEIDADHPFINALIFDHKPGDVVALTVDRSGDEVTVTVTLGERPAETA